MYMYMHVRMYLSVCHTIYLPTYLSVYLSNYHQLGGWEKLSNYLSLSLSRSLMCVCVCVCV